MSAKALLLALVVAGDCRSLGLRRRARRRPGKSPAAMPGADSAW